MTGQSSFPVAPTFIRPADENALSPAVLLRALRKHWGIVLVLTVSAVVSAVLYTSNQRRIYEAVATVQFNPQPLMPLGHAVSPVAASGQDSYWSNMEYFSTQHQVLTSRHVAAAVIVKLGLQRDAGFLRNLPPGATAPDVQIGIDEAADVLRSRLKVEPIEDSRLARVKYRDADPGRAQRLLNAVVNTYVDQNLDASLEATNKTADWLDTQLATLKTELEGQEMDLHDFKVKYNLLSVSYDDQSNMLRAEIAQLNNALITLKAKRESIAAQLAVLQQMNPEDPLDIPRSVLLGRTGLDDLRAAYTTALERREQLVMLGKGPNYPEMLAADAAVARTKQALLNGLSTVKNGVAADLEAANREVNGISGLYGQAKQQAMELNLNELIYSRLHRSKDNTEKLFSLVLERSTESGLSKMMPFNNVRVLDKPLLPKVAVSPNPSANLAFGLMLGLLLGVAGAIGRELLDRTVRSVEDAERELQVPVLGSLPDVTQAAGDHGYYGAYGRRKRKPRASRTAEASVPELYVHTHPKSGVAEAARAIRTNLLFMSPDHPYRSLLITSAGPTEGKTTVASSVAVAMAQTGQRVCLVDCDLRRPRVHVLFKSRPNVGVSTAVLDAASLDLDDLQTDIPNLSVLPAGPTPPNPADLMHSESFGRLLDRLKESFDRVVIDSPPIGIVTDGVVLSTRVDATVLVVRAYKTRKDAARRAVRLLRDVGASCVGFVLNAAATTERYDYSVYYGSYGEQPESAAS